MPDSPALRGRLQKCLDRQYNFTSWGMSIMSLGDFIHAKAPVLKSYCYRELTTHKRNGTYRQLATPKAEYTIWFTPDRKEGLDVPKIVYDALDLPEEKPEYTPDLESDKRKCYICHNTNLTYHPEAGGGWRCNVCGAWQ